MHNKIEAIQTKFRNDINSVVTQQDLESVRITYLGRQGILTDLMTELKSMSADDKRVFGPICNQLKVEFQDLYLATQTVLYEKEAALLAKKSALFDVSISKPGQLSGSLHPYTYITQEIQDIFISMGFSIADGPELETDFHNFGALNIPSDHPARSESDTFWLPDLQRLLRTHTSTVQVRTMKNNTPPIAIVCPGRALRNEATDASHDFMFMQIEGLFIDKDVSVANLLAVIKEFLDKLFGKSLKLRVRPGFFPFVEPGLEVDAECPFCTTGCSTCKGTRWIELMGAGLVHPNVLQECGIDPTIYSGFAFGSGLTRLAMLKYHITDIRLLHSGKIEFLEQF
ncbi:phenylalanine--tRNA ligase subunit alpha [Candidatus Chromulinivorax destructor]|uniref:Phenylalanine--tRNA ligase alpha subunit n=1 Tax=Candidatus Chromulinivorax destructor TaxID=2066483 RepID=A0A345ZAL5_9BACT|nr:phenylalanine--tRNA ligase subunit alpha [Candidatus Chromulinivorax destructor]AXK60332.1 phenylalanine--tRNA ligase subunit alpha [Candidatus Chromulinivorax destructor]